MLYNFSYILQSGENNNEGKMFIQVDNESKEQIEIGLVSADFFESEKDQGAVSDTVLLSNEEKEENPEEKENEDEIVEGSNVNISSNESINEENYGKKE